MIDVEILAKSGEAAKSGPIGFAVILVLCVVCYFLFKSMSKHLKTVRERFPVDQKEPPQPPVHIERTSLEKTERTSLEKPTPEPGGDGNDERPPPAHP